MACDTRPSAARSGMAQAQPTSVPRRAERGCRTDGREFVRLATSDVWLRQRLPCGIAVRDRTSCHERLMTNGISSRSTGTVAKPLTWALRHYQCVGGAITPLRTRIPLR